MRLYIRPKYREGIRFNDKLGLFSTLLIIGFVLLFVRLAYLQLMAGGRFLLTNLLPGDFSIHPAKDFVKGEEVTGTLAPGESATASYRIGHGCAFPCNVACEDPLLGTGRVADLGPCNDGIELTWDAALFPGAGNGIYHVRRSTVSFADARLQSPLTPPAGLGAPAFIDTTPPPNQALYYVVEAESIDFPDCGQGTLVRGSTDEIEIGPIMDSADVAGPTGVVGNNLRATWHTDSTVDFNWLLAGAPEPGETFRVLRADGNPIGDGTTQDLGHGIGIFSGLEVQPGALGVLLQ